MAISIPIGDKIPLYCNHRCQCISAAAAIKEQVLVSSGNALVGAKMQNQLLAKRGGYATVWKVREEV